MAGVIAVEVAVLDQIFDGIDDLSRRGQMLVKHVPLEMSDEQGA